MSVSKSQGFVTDSLILPVVYFSMFFDARDTIITLEPFAHALSGYEIQAIGAGNRFQLLVIKMNIVH